MGTKSDAESMKKKKHFFFSIENAFYKRMEVAINNNFFEIFCVSNELSEKQNDNLLKAELDRASFTMS